MILNAFGIAGLGVAELGAMLTHLDYGYAVVIGNDLQTVNFEVGKKMKQPLVPVIFKGSKTFLTNIHRFTKRDVLCFVIDTPIELSFLNVKMLGVELASKYVYKFTKLDTEVLAKEISLWEERSVEKEDAYVAKHTPQRVLAQIVESYQDSSVLAPLQTFLYTIKDKERRKAIDTLAKAWLTTPASFEGITRRFRRILPENRAALIEALLDTPKFKRLKKAAQLYKKNPDKLATLATQFKVSTYDLRYLVHDRPS